MSIKRTQEIFVDVIKKPQLTDHLLTRPPFKFIVDIVTNVIKSTGYLQTEFSIEEIDQAGTDKHTKTNFLEKLINLLDDGTLKNVKAAKIISGKDVEETNKMLQKLGENAIEFRQKISESNDTTSVEVPNNGTPGKKKKIKKDENDNGQLEKKGNKLKIKTEKEKEKEEKKKTKTGSKDRNKLNGKKQSNEKKKHSKSPENEENTKAHKKDYALQRADSMIAINGDVVGTVHDVDIDDQDLLDTPTKKNEPSSGLDNASIVNNDNMNPEINSDSFKPDALQPVIRPSTGSAGGRPMTSLGRPGTAASRPAPPKIKKKQIATVEVTSQAIEMKSKIINEQDNEEDANENAFVMENEEETKLTVNGSDLINSETRGTLVQKIIETKSEIEVGAAFEQQETEEDDKPISIEREKVKALQEKLQDLTKSAYPLARLFDFANDDIESMIKELERWRSEQRRKELENQNKKASGYGDNSRLLNIISTLQKEVGSYKEELSKTRGRVLKNNQRIQLFISNF